MRPLYIFDLDGTLADIKHRRHLVALQAGSRITLPDGTSGVYRRPNENSVNSVWVETSTGEWSYHISNVKFKPNWDAFHAACVDDAPNEPVIDIFKHLVAHAEVWVWSGRMDTVRKQTVAWLREYVDVDFEDDPDDEVFGVHLRMRLDGDYTPDNKLKERWLLSMQPEDRERLAAVFDDRDRVVAMWRSHGITCLQVAPGDF